jgi:cytochrome c553
MNLRLVLRTAAGAILVCVASALAHAETAGVQTVSPQALEAKFAYCQTCHGRSAQGFRGVVPIPRLAGQPPAYVENQLKAYIEHRLTDPVMAHVAKALNPAMVTALSAKFKDLNPKPLGGAPKDQIAAGKKIYDEGVPGQNVPACTACHGKGNPLFPPLAGQLHDYTIRKMTDWKKRGQDTSGPDSSAVMQPIARGLTEAEIAAIAAYVSTLE